MKLERVGGFLVRRRFVLALWLLAVYLLILYAGLRWGGHTDPFPHRGLD